MEPIKNGVEGLKNRLARTTSQVKSIDSQSSFNSECQVCGGTGYLKGRRGLTECECAIEKRVLTRIPPRYRDANLADFKPSVIDFIDKWLKSKPAEGLLITGKVGCGKTYLACSMIRLQILSHEGKIRFERLSDFYVRCRESFRANTSEEAALQNLPTIKYLYLDDLGAGSLSDFERRATLDLLDLRWNTQLPTIVTTNWPIEEIASKMDERIADRLQSYLPLRLAGDSRRGEINPR